MRICVEGCGHGDLDKIYDSVAIRDETDLQSMACPPQHLKMGLFHEYWKGNRVAPVLTIYVGGNHEASNFGLELYYGGWVCENVYYLGHSSIIDVNGFKIGGISGIYNPKHSQCGYFERPPFSEGTKRSVFHTRDFEIKKMKLWRRTIDDRTSKKNGGALPPIGENDGLDIFISHDWPRPIWNYGDLHYLLKRKPHFADEIREGTFASPSLMEIVHTLKPSFYFAAHLHVKFVALYNHDDEECGHGALNADYQGVDLIAVSKRNEEKNRRNGRMPKSVSGQQHLKQPLTEDEEHAMRKAADRAMTMERRQAQIRMGGGNFSQMPMGGNFNQMPMGGNFNQMPMVTNSMGDMHTGMGGNFDQYGMGRNSTPSSYSSTKMNPNFNPNKSPHVTRFLSLDKCLPGRDFLQVLELEKDENGDTILRKIPYDVQAMQSAGDCVPVSGGIGGNSTLTSTFRNGRRQPTLKYDFTWLAILKKNFPHVHYMYDPKEPVVSAVLRSDVEELRRKFEQDGNPEGLIPDFKSDTGPANLEYGNEQRKEINRLLEIRDIWEVRDEKLKSAGTFTGGPFDNQMNMSKKMDVSMLDGGIPVKKIRKREIDHDHMCSEDDDIEDQMKDGTQCPQMPDGMKRPGVEKNGDDIDEEIEKSEKRRKLTDKEDVDMNDEISDEILDGDVESVIEEDVEMSDSKPQDCNSQSPKKPDEDKPLDEWLLGL